MTPRLSVVVTLLLSLGWMVPVATQAPVASAFKQENTPDNLQALLRHIFQKFHVDKSPQDGKALFKALLPDERRLRLALRYDLESGTLQKLLEQYKGSGSDMPEDFTLGRPEMTEVQVHGGTTEAIKAGSAAGFPGGARQMAERVLRPGMTFYEVEFLKPGETAGTTYHLFYWDGQQWSMLGGLWRALR